MVWPQLTRVEDRFLDIGTTISAPPLAEEYVRRTEFWERILQQPGERVTQPKTPKVRILLSPK